MVNTLDKIYNSTRSLNEMPLHERMEYQRIHDRAITLQAAMRGAAVELKTLGQKKHPFALENIRNN